MRSSPAICFSASGSCRSSASIPVPSTNSVTRAGGSVSSAATRGAIPTSAAPWLASRSALRSIPSRFVSLPGTLITYRLPPSVTR